MTKHAKAACIFVMASVVFPGLVAAALTTSFGWQQKTKSGNILAKPTV